MKKRILRLILALFCIGSMFAAEIESAIIKKIASTKFKEFFSKELVTQMVQRANKHTSDYERPDWSYSYRVLREVAYKESFGLYDGVAKGKKEGELECYENLRALFLARAKEELHRGKTNALLALYEEHHDTIMTTLKELPAADLPKVAYLVESAKEVFKMMKNQKPDEIYRSILGSNGWYEESSDLLLKNLTAAETAQAIIKASEKHEKPLDKALADFTEKRYDRDLILFAYRRHLEGGPKLLDKYLALIEAMQKDIAKLAAGN